MEFLNVIVESVKTGNAGAVMTVLGALAFILTVVTQFGHFISAITRWRIWGWTWRWTGRWAGRTSKRLYMWLLVKYRRRKANRIMEGQVQAKIRTATAQAFDRSLASDPWNSTRLHLGHLTPEKPRWLNDHYAASALETLSREGKVVKAREFERLGWPPSVLAYKIWSSNRNDLSLDEFEADGRCRAYQHFGHCALADRFEEILRVETVDVHRTIEDWTYPVKETAPPCERCWERDQHQWETLQLVSRLTRYDFWQYLSPETQQNLSEFQEHIVAVCVECGCVPELEKFKRIVERAIEIRRVQLDSSNLSEAKEWTEQLVADFANALSEYIRGELK